MHLDFDKFNLRVQNLERLRASKAAEMEKAKASNLELLEASKAATKRLQELKGQMLETQAALASVEEVLPEFGRMRPEKHATATAGGPQSGAASPTEVTLPAEVLTMERWLENVKQGM